MSITTVKELKKTYQLTPAQTEALLKLIEIGDWVSPYDSQLSVRVVNTLYEKGLLRMRTLGSGLYSPAVNVLYKARFRIPR